MNRRTVLRIHLLDFVDAIVDDRTVTQEVIVTRNPEIVDVSVMVFDAHLSDSIQRVVGTRQGLKAFLRGLRKSASGPPGWASTLRNTAKSPLEASSRPDVRLSGHIGRRSPLECARTRRIVEAHTGGVGSRVDWART